MNHAAKITRRDFLAAAALAPLATSAAEGNLWDALKATPLTGQDGLPVNIDALRDRLKGKFVTLSYGFNGCKLYCDPNDWALSQMKNPNIVHIVINTAPDGPGGDNISPEKRTAWQKTFVERGVNPFKLRLLYPKETGDDRAIVRAAGIVGRPKSDKASPDEHYPKITLYNPDGSFNDRQLAADALTVWRNKPELGMAR